MAPGSTSLEVRLVVGLDGVGFVALVALPLLHAAVLPPVVLLDAHQIAQCMRRIVVQASWLRAHVHTLPRRRHGAGAGMIGRIVIAVLSANLGC